MFHSPYCFLSKNYSEPHSQNRLYEASFCWNICQIFMQISIILPHIKKPVQETALSIQISCPHTGFLLISDFLIFSNF